MNEMIERCKKAIEAEMFKIQDFDTGQGIVSAEDIAIVCIKTLLEPTEEMKNVFYNQCGTSYYLGMLNKVLEK